MTTLSPLHLIRDNEYSMGSVPVHALGEDKDDANVKSHYCHLRKTNTSTTVNTTVWDDPFDYSRTSL